MDEDAALTPLPPTLQKTQTGLDKGAPGSAQHSVERKGTLSALWDKKDTKKMNVIDMTEDDDCVVLEEKTQPLEEKQVPEVHSCEDLTAEAKPAEKVPASTSQDQGTTGQASNEDSSKKRKRSTLPENMVEDLESLFSKDPFPSKEARVELAARHSIEEKKVSNWFERRRKIARANGDVLEKPSAKKEDTEEQKKKVSTATVLLSDEALGKLVGMTRKELEDEVSVTRKNGLLAPMKDLTLIQDPVEYSEAMLCSLVAGQRMTLTELIHGLHPLFSSNQPSEDALRASIACLLQRKSCDPINKGVKLTESMDWENEGVEGEGLWQWEVRNKDLLSKSCAVKSGAIKKRASKIGERLRAIDALLKLVDDSGDKAEKAVAAFKKSSSLSALEEELKLQQNVEKMQEDKQRQKVEREVEKAKQAEEKKKKRELAEQEKELKRKEREAAKLKAAEEKEAKRQKIQAEKERLKEMKEQEMQRKKEESSMQKLAKRTGFKDKDSLNKTANRFKTFFAAAAPSKPDHSGQASDSHNASYFDKRFPKPPGYGATTPVSISLDQALSSKMDEQTVMHEWKAFLSRSAEASQAAKREEKETCMGLPPSWAQKSDAKQAAKQRMVELTGSGLSSDMIQTWRRKFIWFPCDSKRPPFYGSNSASSGAIHARNPFGKESSLDYEVMSDIDWEDEPEGSSLSRDSLQSEGGNESLEEEENSFFVADGYLSADEGIGSEEDEAIQQQMEEIVTVPENDTTGKNNVRKTSRKALIACLEKSKRSGKPFIVSRSSITADANHGACFHGDSALSEGLAMEILLPGALLEIPEDPHAPVEASPEPKVTSPNEAREIGEHVASMSGTMHADLLPELSAYIVNNATSTKALLIEGFLQQHSDRKITKKWINENISMLAKRSGSKWSIKEKNEVTTTQHDEVETPLCTIKAPQTSEKKNPPCFISKATQDEA